MTIDNKNNASFLKSLDVKRNRKPISSYVMCRIVVLSKLINNKDNGPVILHRNSKETYSYNEAKQHNTLKNDMDFHRMIKPSTSSSVFRINLSVYLFINELTPYNLNDLCTIRRKKIVKHK